MVKGLYTAYTGMVNEMKRMDVLANNLANADTYGFKKEGTTSHSFEEEMAIRIKDSSNYGLPKRLGGITYGVKLGETYTNWDSGSFKVTDNPSDLAIEGNGFFAVAFQDKQGNTSIKYSRDVFLSCTNTSEDTYFFGSFNNRGISYNSNHYRRYHQRNSSKSN